jgi:hypothetical protein
MDDKTPPIDDRLPTHGELVEKAFQQQKDNLAKSQTPEYRQQREQEQQAQMKELQEQEEERETWTANHPWNKRFGCSSSSPASSSEAENLDRGNIQTINLCESDIEYITDSINHLQINEETAPERNRIRNKIIDALPGT